MDQLVLRGGTDSGNKKFKVICRDLEGQNQISEEPIHWEAKPAEYDSGPKMGID